MMLTDANRGNWVNAGFSSHEKVKEKESELDGLNRKGYIFGEYYSGVVCLNDDHVCARIVEDKDGNMSESTIALSRNELQGNEGTVRRLSDKGKKHCPCRPENGENGDRYSEVF